ncbi:MAG: hypothetical protein CBB67_018520 [Alteromonadaceae bacterium TMED7]|nr:hypothetical protein [Alteromonadaceae bacterium]RPH15119.1 MAG: hypothetical protein CBB67_018520 [Alteromonadaceae bacterium TMED7]
MHAATHSMFPATEQALLSPVELNTLATLMLPGLPQNNSSRTAPEQAPQPSLSFAPQLEEDPEDDADPAYLDDPDYTPDDTNTQPIPAGYTYICQFIAHDIIADSHFHIGGRHTSARLNLDSMYGNDGSGDPIRSIEVRYFDSESGRFLTQAHDVHRVAPGTIENAPWATAWMPEQRNDENAIVLQLHSLFQSLHNAFISALPATQTDMAERIITARRYTVAVFHHIVINDLLPKLVLADCHEYFFNKLGPFYYGASRPYTQVPAEFKLASFRFGHSMLRPRYHLKTEYSQSFSLDEIMRRPPFEPLDEAHVVDWPALFFDPLDNEGLQQIASPIDLFITSDMATVPHPTNPRAGRNIAQLNLLAGIKLGLNSAENILRIITTEPHFKPFAKYFKQRLNHRKLVVTSPGQETDFIYALLAVLQEQQRTPLWLYTLQENLTDYADNNQYKLGLVASAINCDVLRSAMYECYLNSEQDGMAQLADNLTTTIQQAFACLGKPLHTMADITTFLTTRSHSDE